MTKILAKHLTIVATSLVLISGCGSPGQSTKMRSSTIPPTPTMESEPKKIEQYYYSLLGCKPEARPGSGCDIGNYYISVAAFEKEWMAAFRFQYLISESTKKHGCRYQGVVYFLVDNAVIYAHPDFAYTQKSMPKSTLNELSRKLHATKLHQCQTTHANDEIQPIVGNWREVRADDGPPHKMSIRKEGVSIHEGIRDCTGLVSYLTSSSEGGGMYGFKLKCSDGFIYRNGDSSLDNNTLYLDLEDRSPSDESAKFLRE
ncbi:hypothetical protein EDD27_9128 [Nonomuraea polychroma]|uniref:Lipoprotein n=1 Tax=Nonomuraea polychroma TaxID=46176 RepID=A0A438MKN6_9ACTN|nr:hypothetical protein EDD27_9128 [Nonomuraea polychroma]